jgi:hypothetical protein
MCAATPPTRQARPLISPEVPLARVSLAVSYARVCSGTCPGENTVLKMSGGEHICGSVSASQFNQWLGSARVLQSRGGQQKRGLPHAPVKIRHTQHIVPQMAPAIIPAISTVSPMSSRHTYVFGGERKKESKKDWVRAEDTPAALAHSNSGEGGELSRA